MISDFLEKRLADKLRDVPPDKIISPNPHVVGPAIEALKFTAQESDLREMFSSLIANAMVSDRMVNVHPAFVDMIKSMSGDDAKVMKQIIRESPSALIDIKVSATGTPGWHYIARNVGLVGSKAGLADPWLAIAAINNLERLGLITLLSNQRLKNEDAYEEIIGHSDIVKIKNDNTVEGTSSVIFDRHGAEITRLGRMFAASCIS